MNIVIERIKLAKMPFARWDNDKFQHVNATGNEEMTMAYKDYKESTRKAISKYDSKTYKRMMLRLRNDEDADIIQSLREAQANGKTNREWLRGLFRGC